jgi:hypothetical protein
LQLGNIKTGKGMQKKALVRNQNGTSAVEFAIILFVFLVFIFAVIEFGLLLFNTQMINNATREGARAGIVVRIPRLSDTEIDTIVRNYCEQNLVTFGSGALDIPKPLLREDPTGNPLVAGELGGFRDFLTIRVTYQYDWLFLTNLGIGPKTIKVVSRMRME